MTSLMHKHADIAIYTLRCKVTKENDFSKYVKPKTAIRELSSNVEWVLWPTCALMPPPAFPPGLAVARYVFRRAHSYPPGISTQFDKAKRPNWVEKASLKVCFSERVFRG